MAMFSSELKGQTNKNHSGTVSKRLSNDIMHAAADMMAAQRLQSGIERRLRLPTNRGS